MTQSTRFKLCAAVVLTGLMICLAELQARQNSDARVLPTDADIRKILAERVDTIGGREDGFGIVVGVIEPQGSRVVSYGHRSLGDARPLDGDTGFEIASVTKTFTALLLADMVQKGEVVLTDPVAKYLPAGVKVPERNGRSITLLDLATHTSGLPFMPGEPSASDDSAAKYGAPQIYQFLGRFQLTRDPGAEWDYSNIGYWLLGQALASRARMAYENLLLTRVIAPLKLKNTAITLSPTMHANLAVGHDAALQPAPLLSTLPMYAGMSTVLNLDSTANDLLKLLSVSMGYESSPLAPAMTAMLRTHRPMQPGVEQALGWVVIREGDDQLIFHDGGSLGFATAVAWDPKKRVGVVVLSNQVTSVSDIARHLLRPNVPLEKPAAAKHVEITLDSAVLDTYTGRYEAQGEGIFTITREGTFLTIQFPADWGLPKLRLRPESQRDFFASELPLRVTFQAGDDGQVNGLLVHPPRGQQAVLAHRIASNH